MQPTVKQKKYFQEFRIRSQSQDIYEVKSDRQQEDSNYFITNDKQEDDNDDICTCTCTKCQSSLKNGQSNNLDPTEKKKQKRKEYKKRQKLKIQQKKLKGLTDLESIIVRIYGLKTSFQKQQQNILQCLNSIQKNQNKFYEFINAIIRQQVQVSFPHYFGQIIKKQIHKCLSEIISFNKEEMTSWVNLSKVPMLYQQFLKIKHSSVEVEMIINMFIKIISQKNQQIPEYHKNLDKKTFRYLLLADEDNKTNILKLIKLIQVQKLSKHERELQILKQIVEIIKELNLDGQSSDNEDEESDGQARSDEPDSRRQLARKSSYLQQNQSYDQSQQKLPACKTDSSRNNRFSERIRENMENKKRPINRNYINYLKSRGIQVDERNSSSPQRILKINMREEDEEEEQLGCDDHLIKQNITKSSDRYNEQEESQQFAEGRADGSQRGNDSSQLKNQSNINPSSKNKKKKRKNKGLKAYESSYQKIYEHMILLQKTLNTVKPQSKLSCNIEDEWLNKFRRRHLKRVKLIGEMLSDQQNQ